MKILLHLTLVLLLGCNPVKKRDNTTLLKNGNYLIEDVLIKTRDGAEISAIICRKKDNNEPQAVILQSTIYVRDTGRDLITLKESVDKGYVGVIAYARGKRFSLDEIWPYENDANDTYDVIDWVSRQEWCDGRIGMFGGSYNGFTQWASLKTPHPALKTIVPYVANRPGMGLPMENNVFLNPNYEWAFYVGNNKSLDTVAGNNKQRYKQLMIKWWETGVSYRKMDSLDGVPNRWFQRWISHPSFDEYWQKMAPYEKDFAKIDIPILTIDGYYNDSQNSGLYYLKEHYKYAPNAEHYLIIGPYSHFGAQRNGEEEINGYQVDKNALIDTKEITYQWFNYIFNGGDKPAKLKDKINYQVMGANEWRSASSIKDMSNKSQKLYLTNAKYKGVYALSDERPVKSEFLSQTVNFAERETWNNDYYPNPIIKEEIDYSNGFNFISEPFDESVIINGSFSGCLNVSLNKQDFDFGVTLYEVMPDGKLFHLSYIISRASYTQDIEHRQLLKPQKVQRILFSNTHLVSKKLDEGSRLLVHINVNKNPFSELNYGTGKIVSEETINDANDPLELRWYNNSYVEIPILKN